MLLAFLLYIKAIAEINAAVAICVVNRMYALEVNKFVYNRFVDL